MTTLLERISASDHQENQSLEEVNNNTSCPICLDSLFKIRPDNLDNSRSNYDSEDEKSLCSTVPCGHIFHYECFSSWKESQLDDRNNNRNIENDTTRSTPPTRSRIKCPTCNKRTKTCIKLFLSSNLVIQPQSSTSLSSLAARCDKLEDSLTRRKEKCKKLSKEKRILQRQLNILESEMDSNIQREVERQVDYHNETIQGRLDTMRERTIHEKQQFQIQYAKLNDKLLEALQEQVTMSTSYEDLKRELTEEKTRTGLLERKYYRLLLGQNDENHLDKSQLWNLSFQMEECSDENKHGETILPDLLDDRCEMTNQCALLRNPLVTCQGVKQVLQTGSPGEELRIDRHHKHVRMIQEETTRLTLDVQTTSLECSELQLQTNEKNDSHTRQRRKTRCKRGSSSSSSSSGGFFFHHPSWALFSR